MSIDQQLYINSSPHLENLAHCPFEEQTQPLEPASQVFSYEGWLEQNRQAREQAFDDYMLAYNQWNTERKRLPVGERSPADTERLEALGREVDRRCAVWSHLVRLGGDDE